MVEGTASVTSSAERSALKEWAVLIDAMAAGEIVAMIRKGGVRERRAGFSVRHDRFILYPTYFHERPSELAPRFRPRCADAASARAPDGFVRIAQVAQVAATWAVTELERLQRIGDAHGLDWHAVESRFHYRGVPGVHVIALRVARLAQPVTIVEARRYAGCVSWVELDDAIETAGALPALSDGDFEARLGAMATALDSIGTRHSAFGTRPHPAPPSA